MRRHAQLARVGPIECTYTWQLNVHVALGREISMQALRIPGRAENGCSSEIDIVAC